jgi:hypothetical protein
MTVNRTTLLDLPLPVTGTESGTWGDTTNNGLTQYMDIAIAGMSNLTSANFTAGALTIETTEGDSSATNISATSAQYAGFRVTSLAANSTITVGNTGTSPARSYRLINADATYNLTFKATGQTGVTLLPGQSAVVAFNGTDYVIVGTVGAGTATDNAVARFDGTTGEILQNSAATIDDTGAATFVGSVNVSGTSASAADLKLYEDTDNGTNYVAFKAPAAVTSNLTLTLPAADGTNGQALTTNGSGTLAFSSVTTAPGGSTTQVQYNNAGVFAGSSNLTFDGTNLTSGGTVTATKLIPTGNVTAGNGMYLPTTNTLAFSTDGSERMRIDSSGNVGIGVTPPTVSQGRLLSLAYSGSGISVTSGADANFTNNAYYNTAWKYGQSSPSARLQMSDDLFIFYNAATGTAGNNITFTERMRINASGNVGIGDSSPGYRLTVATTTLIYTDSVNSNNYSLSNGGTNYGGGVAPYLTVAGAGGSYGYLLIKGGDGGTSNTANMAFANKNSAGNYILGALIACNVTTATAGSEVQAFRIAVNSGGTVTDRMRINADGTIKTSATISVGDATPSTSGAGITFPATQSASSDANTLDDYEEGTWTPSQGAGLTVVGTFSSAGRYTKIGRTVFIVGRLTASTSVAFSGGASAVCGNLPFTANTNNPPIFVGTGVNEAANASAVVQIYSATVQGVEALAATTNFYFSMTYDV